MDYDIVDDDESYERPDLEEPEPEDIGGYAPSKTPSRRNTKEGGSGGNLGSPASILKPRKKPNISDAERERRRIHMINLRAKRIEKQTERAELKAKLEAEKLELKIQREEQKKALAEQRERVRMKKSEEEKKLAELRVKALEAKKKGKKGGNNDVPPVPPVASPVEVAPPKVEKEKKSKPPKKPIKIINKMDSDDDTDDSEDDGHGGIVIVNKMPKKKGGVAVAAEPKVVVKSKPETVCRFV